MQLIGAFVGGLAAAKIPIIEINTSTWRKQIFHGSGNKEKAVRLAIELLGYEPDTDDEAEALCIAYAGYQRWITGIDSW